MDINYFMKIQNAYGTKNRREKELAKINNEMSKHFEDTYGTVDILLNGTPTQLMIIKDTDNNTFKKKIKSVHGNKFNLGDYIEWNSQKWLVTLIDADERTWNRGYMYLCTVPLRWQNSDGKIIERWVYAEDFTKYSNGVNKNSIITVGDNQYGLTVPVDSETKKLKRDMRFAIDFDDSEQPDIYKLTNRKVKLNDNQYFGRGGTMILTASFDVFNPKDDKKILIENGQEVWICNYNNSYTPLLPTPQRPNEMTDLRCVISGNINLKNGYRRIYTVAFTDKNGNPLDWQEIDYRWEVISDFDIEQSINDNKITLSVNDENLIGGSFFVSICVGKTVLSEIKVNVVE